MDDGGCNDCGGSPTQREGPSLSLCRRSRRASHTEVLPRVLAVGGTGGLLRPVIREPGASALCGRPAASRPCGSSADEGRVVHRVRRTWRSSRGGSCECASLAGLPRVGQTPYLRVLEGSSAERGPDRAALMTSTDVLIPGHIDLGVFCPGGLGRFGGVCRVRRRV